MNFAPISPVEKRRIEADIVKQIYDEMAATYGKTSALNLIRKVITKTSIEEGAQYAREASCDPTPEFYLALMMDWATDGTLEIVPVSASSDHAHFQVRRCLYAEMYQLNGLTELGQILSCGRDGTVCSGYNPNITLERTQTIMEGADYCDFRLKIAKAN